MEEPEPSVLWTEMERRRADLRVSAEGTANTRTRKKIKSGMMVEPEVYDRLDVRLRWVRGDARRAAIRGVKPRPLEGQPEAIPGRRLRRFEVAALYNRIGAMLADSSDEVDPAVLVEAERLALETMERLRREKEADRSGSNGAKPS